VDFDDVDESDQMNDRKAIDTKGVKPPVKVRELFFLILTKCGHF
jgi:hypothetical protein